MNGGVLALEIPNVGSSSVSYRIVRGGPAHAVASRPFETLAQVARSLFSDQLSTEGLKAPPECTIRSELAEFSGVDDAFFFVRVSPGARRLEVTPGATLRGGELTCSVAALRAATAVDAPLSLWDPEAGCTPGYPRLFEVRGVLLATPGHRGTAADCLMPTLDTFILCGAVAEFIASEPRLFCNAPRGTSPGENAGPACVDVGAGCGFVGKFVASQPGFAGDVFLVDVSPLAAELVAGTRFGRRATPRNGEIVFAQEDAEAFFGRRRGARRFDLVAPTPPTFPRRAISWLSKSVTRLSVPMAASKAPRPAASTCSSFSCERRSPSRPRRATPYCC